MYRYIFSIIFSFSFLTIGISQDENEIRDIYTIEDDSTYSLIIDHNHKKLEYFVQEIFDPPTLIIEINNVSWDRGNFSRKSAHSPLYQYDVKSQNKLNQSKQTITGIRLRMSFNSIPKYSVIESGIGRTKNLIIKWNKNKPREKDIYLSSFRRLPDSKVSFNFKEADLLTVVRLMASQENLNLVLGGDLSGSVTIKLTDVTLETAMDAILHVNGYEWFLQENIIVIKPSSPDSQLSGELDTQIYRLRFVHGAIITEALEEVLTERGKVKSLSSSQSLDYDFEIDDIVMVTDVPTNFALIDRVIGTIDQEGAQINIAVKFIETTLKRGETIGIDWNLRQSMQLPGNKKGVFSDNINFSEIAFGIDTMSFATLTAPVVSAMLDLLANDDDTKLLQEPQVTTMNNSPANIVVGTTIPILVPQGEGSVFGTNPYTYENQDVNIALDVLPRLNAYNAISLAINTSVQAIIGYTGENSRPIVSNRETNTNVRVKDGETLLIGGMIFETEEEKVNKVPLLGDIPLIKSLFRFSSIQKEQRELLIFITPTIISQL
jgi:type II secretory pathway component GspD/PulD (secretin)